MRCRDFTVTVKVQFVVPLASLAVACTTVVPTGNVLPEGGTAVITGTLLQVSLAVTVKNTTAGPTDVTTMFDGQWMLSTHGGVLVRFTVTWKLQLVNVPQESLALHVTVVVPIGKVLPLGGLQLMNGGGLHPPDAVLVKNTVAPFELVALTVMFDEYVNTMGVGGAVLFVPGDIVPGAVVEGVHVCPPSRLISVKMSKKLLIMYPPATGAIARLAAFFAGLGGSIVQRRWQLVVCAVMVMAVTPFGLHRLVVQDSWTDAFDPESEFRRTTRLVNSNFYGMHLLLVSVDASDQATGELPAPPDGQSRILLPGDICNELQEIESSAITISAGAARRWHSQIELLRRTGTNITAWVMPTPEGDGFARDAGTNKIRFELAVRSQLKPAVVAAHRALADFLRERQDCGVGGVIGPYEYLATTRFMTQPDNPAPRELLGLASENRTLWNYYEFALGQNRFRKVMDTNYWQSLTTVFLKDANFADTARLMSAVRAYERERLTPKGIKLGFAGDVALSQSLIRDIVTTQLQSLGWSLGGIFLVTALLGGSWRWGIFCVLPSALAVLFKFAVMGWAGIPLGVATSMFAAMTLGIGVNCAVQLLEALTQARADGMPPPQALSRALGLTGVPALINTLAVSLGFGVLILSQVPANARLGILVVLGLVNCLVASLLLLPVLAHWWPIKPGNKTESPGR